jgi:hypothetical protein
MGATFKFNLFLSPWSILILFVEISFSMLDMLLLAGYSFGEKKG